MYIVESLQFANYKYIHHFIKRKETAWFKLKLPRNDKCNCDIIFHIQWHEWFIPLQISSCQCQRYGRSFRWPIVFTTAWPCLKTYIVHFYLNILFLKPWTSIWSLFYYHIITVQWWVPLNRPHNFMLTHIMIIIVYTWQHTANGILLFLSSFWSILTLRAANTVPNML